MNDEAFHLTPVDARRFDFGSALRGYDKTRVDQFRDQVADELERLETLVRDGMPAPRVHIRVTPGVEAFTHEYIETGTEDSKFGFGLDRGEALAAVQRVVEQGLLEFAGVHCHIGSQVLRLDAFARAIDKMVGLVRAIEVEVGVAVEELNVGCGLCVRYLSEDVAPTIEQYAAAVH